MTRVRGLDGARQAVAQYDFERSKAGQWTVSWNLGDTVASLTWRCLLSSDHEHGRAVAGGLARRELGVLA